MESIPYAKTFSQTHPTDAQLQEQATAGYHEHLADTQLVPGKPELLDPSTDFDPAALEQPTTTVHPIVQQVGDSTRLPEEQHRLSGSATHDIQTVVTEDNAGAAV